MKFTVVPDNVYRCTQPSSAPTDVGHQVTGDVMGTLPSALAADLDNFIEWMRGQRMAATTVANRARLIAARLLAWGTWDVSPSAIAAWIDRYDGWSAHTYYLHLRSAYRFATEFGLVAVDPMLRIRRPPQPEPSPHPLSPAEMEAVLSDAKPKVRQYLLLAYLAGLRSHEVAKFRGEDITKSSIRVVGKGGQSVILPTHPVLWELAQTMPTTGWWFPSRQSTSHVTSGRVTAMVADHLRTHGVRTGSIHRVRASYGTDLLRSGANVRVVQKLMRHRSLTSTERYLGVAADEMALALQGLSA